MHEPKSLLLHLDGSARCADRIELARQLIENFDARADALYAVTPPCLRYPEVLETGVGSPADFLDMDRQERERARQLLRAHDGGSPRLVWMEQDGHDPTDFAQQALHADLLVLGQRDPGDKAIDELPADFLPNLLIETGRPALVLPYTGGKAPVGRKVMVAWKQTRESARALAAALPWLRRAEQVHLVCHDAEAEAALQQVRRHLLMHGIATQLHRGANDHDRVGEALLSEAADLGADLLVMGCYGHSRAREWVLGGVTRTLLQSMTLPVLLVH